MSGYPSLFCTHLSHAFHFCNSDNLMKFFASDILVEILAADDRRRQISDDRQMGLSDAHIGIGSIVQRHFEVDIDSPDLPQKFHLMTTINRQFPCRSLPIDSVIPPHLPQECLSILLDSPSTTAQKSVMDFLSSSRSMSSPEVVIPCGSSHRLIIS